MAASSNARLRDVVVIGAGPAGSMTALRLAEQGRDVLLLEEHEAVGSPVHCTGLLGLEAFGEFDLPRETILGHAAAAQFWGAAGQSVVVRSDRVHAAVVDRAALDVHLAERATRAGADLKRGCRADRISVAPDRVSIEGRGLHAPVHARAVVLACGANYRFHKQLGLGTSEVFLQSAQIETPFPQVGDVQVRFGRGVAPAGFAWLVPLQRAGRSFARIGLITESRSRERFAAFSGALGAQAGADPAGLPAPRLKILPLGPIAKTYSDRVIAVGDAAGLVKPTTGGGIYYGLLSGTIAADVLGGALENDRLDAAALRQYESSWRKRLGQEIRVGLAFRRIAARLSDDSIDALIELARVNGIVPLLQQHASFNWHGKAAIALLAHPSFRKIVFKSWRSSDGLI